ncbi:MAG: hypothetical protein HY986_21410 [Candidatus Melainabacteria bacterium]|nr:hypothetical protein [Candidatus Melainabacteria bacterium]
MRDMTDSSGNVLAHYEYDMYGQATQTVGNPTVIRADFQYAGYYSHQPSGLNLATYRAYNHHNKEAENACSGKKGAAYLACICAFLDAGYESSSGKERKAWDKGRKAAGCKHSRCTGNKKKEK